MSDVIIRSATPADARRLSEIYAYYVTNTAVSFEYDPPDEAQMRRRVEHTLSRYPYLVAERNGEVLGFAYAEALRERPAYDRSVELTIYLDPAARRMGLGRMLYTHIEDILRDSGMTNLYTCVAVADVYDEYLTPDSLNFHTHMGYTVCGRFHGCGQKFGRTYDIVWMEKLI